MGGNIRIDYNGLEIRPSSIDLRKHSRLTLRNNIFRMMRSLNNEFSKEYGYYLWGGGHTDFKKFFSGSSEHFADLELSDREFIKYKPIIGDIDIGVPADKADKLLKLLVPDKMFWNMKFLGSKTVLDEIHCIFLFEDLMFQIDFDLIWVKDTHDDYQYPIEFAMFGKSSDWQDITLGIKGVFHKLLLNSIDAATSFIIPLYTEKKRKFKGKIFTQLNTFYVKKGFRPRYKKIQENMWVEVKPSEAHYISSLPEIFRLLFRRDPSAVDLHKMWSFHGLVKLIDYSFNEYEKKNIVNAYMDKIYGKRSKLFASTETEDRMIKEDTISYLVNNIPSLSNYILQRREEYYGIRNNTENEGRTKRKT